MNTLLTFPTYIVSGGIIMHGIIVFASIFCGIFGAVEILHVLYCAVIKHIGRKGAEHNGTGSQSDVRGSYGNS